MRFPRKKNRAWLSEEETYNRFTEVFDLDVFALELEYSDRIGGMIRKGVEQVLDRKQHDFEVMLAAHPATAAEESCRGMARQLEEERQQEIAKRRAEREGKTVRTLACRLARRWHAKFAPAHAS